MDTASRSTASCETSCSMARSSTALRKPKRSSRNGVSTTTPGDPIRRSVTDLRHHSPSRRHHQPSTGRRSCNNLSLRLVQNIGQATRYPLLRGEAGWPAPSFRFFGRIERHNLVLRALPVSGPGGSPREGRSNKICANLITSRCVLQPLVVARRIWAARKLKSGTVVG